MRLSDSRFESIVQDTVLVALDLLIVKDRDQILVGPRSNPPAKDFLFVPGGRVRKMETLGQALERISQNELGVQLRSKDAVLYGVYDHIYDENFRGDSDFSTHYVVIACLFRVSDDVLFRADDQHKYLGFMSIKDLLNHPKVHSLTKNYFVDDPDNLFLRSYFLNK